MAEIANLQEPWERHTGQEVENFVKGKMTEHETDIENLQNDAIGEVVDGTPNPATNKKKLTFFKVGDTEHENPIEIEVMAGETGVTKQPKVTVTLNTAGTIKKGDAIDFDWVYDFIYTINGEPQEEKELPYSINVKIKSGSIVYYDETTYGDGTQTLSFSFAWPQGSSTVEGPAP